MTNALTRWLHSIAVAPENGGANVPWQLGQSGHASPALLAMTFPPRTIVTYVAKNAAMARRRRFVCFSTASPTR